MIPHPMYRVWDLHAFRPIVGRSVRGPVRPRRHDLRFRPRGGGKPIRTGLGEARTSPGEGHELVSSSAISSVGRGMAASPVQGVAAPAPGASSKSGLGGLIAALQAMIADPPAQPPVAERVAAILRRIPAGSQRVVIWVRGTNDRSMRPDVRAAFDREMPGEQILEIDYEASWRFAESVPDGAAVLRGVLEALARRRPRPQVMLAGESQGAWVISTALEDPSLAQVVTRAVLWGAPAAAPVDFADRHDPRVHEINHPGDIVTMDLGDAANQRLVSSIDKLAHRRYLAGLLPIVTFGLTHPAVLGRLIRAQLWRIPGLGSKFPSPHGYDFIAGVRYLRTGQGDPDAARGVAELRVPTT